MFGGVSVDEGHESDDEKSVSSLSGVDSTIPEEDPSI
jgi:hypothetical protein